MRQCYFCSVGSDSAVSWLLLEFQRKTWSLVFTAVCKLMSGLFTLYMQQQHLVVSCITCKIIFESGYYEKAVLNAKGSSVTDRNFITRMIFKDIYRYWLILIFLFIIYVCLLLDIISYFNIIFSNCYHFTLFCCSLSTCFKVLIDLLIHSFIYSYVFSVMFIYHRVNLMS